MLLNSARKPLRTIVILLFILPLAGCVNGSDPLAPAGTSDLTFTHRLVELPAAEQLSGAYKCAEVLVVPEKSSSVRVKFASLWFHEGAVTEPLTVEVCAERTFYAVDLYPSGSTFDVPVDVQFRLAKELFNEGEIEGLNIVLVLENGSLEIIPSEVVVKGNLVDVNFQINHFSRYALVLD